MDDTVRLGASSQGPSNQVPIDLDEDFTTVFGEEQVHLSNVPEPSKGGRRGRGRSSTLRSSSVSSHTEAAAPHKVRGPNWTEEEMLVLIG